MGELKHRRGPRKKKRGNSRRQQDEWSGVVREEDWDDEDIDQGHSPKAIRTSEEARESARRRRTKREKQQANKKKNNVISLIMIAICAIIFCVSGYQLYSILAEYKAGSDSYAEITELGIYVPETFINEDGEEEEVPYEYYYVDFASLLAENPDTVGWIRFDSPEIINYPLVKTDDNETYLMTTFSGEANSAGTLFLDMYNGSYFMDDNTIIYGHNMKNDTMFGALNEYNDVSFYEEYPYFYIYTPDGKATKYQVAVAEIIDATDMERYTINFEGLTDYQAYIDDMFKTSFYDTGAEVDTYSKLVTLSTCTDDSNTRFIVQGVKIESKDMVVPEDQE